MSASETRSTAYIDNQKNVHGKVKTYLIFKWWPADKYPVRLTHSQASLILKHLEKLKLFVEGSNLK